MRKIYITNNGLHEILEGQDNLIQEDWVKCELDKNGQPYTKYLGDGKPDLVKEQALLDAKVLEEADKARSKAMLDGVDYNGTVVSLTKSDGDGLVQVKSGFELGLTDTVIHFENGAKLPMNVADFPEFALWFVNERNKFFTVA